MEWQDEEFEAFLQQFRAPKPKALTVRRHPLLAFVLAAVLLLAIVLPIGWWMGVGVRNDFSEGAPPSTPANISNSTTQKPLREIPLKRWQRPGYQAGGANGGANDQRLRVGGAIKPPASVVKVNPIYPEDAQAAGIEGIVILEVVIGEDGSVVEAWVLQSIPELDQAAINAVTEWKYEPTLMNGEPVEVEMVVTINFTLTGV